MCRAACSPIQYIKRFKSDVTLISLLFFFFSRRSFAVHHTLFDPHLLAFGLYEIFVSMFALSIQLLRIIFVHRFIAARKATITKETTKNKRERKKYIFIHLICLHDIRWPGIREFITRIEGETQNSIYRFPNKYFIYLHVFVIEHFHSCFSTIFPPTAVCSTHVCTRIVLQLPMVCVREPLWPTSAQPLFSTCEY